MGFPSARNFICFLVLTVWFTPAVRAQDPAKEHKQDLDALARAQYVERFTEYFFIWPVVKQRTTSFTIQNLQNKDQKLIYRPNTTYQLGAGANLFGIGVQLTFALPPSQSSIDKYGKSKAHDLQGNLLGKNWGLDVYTQKYSGYYQIDPSQPLPSGLPNTQRSDVTTWNTGVTGIYFFNKRKYSFRATYNYFERQLKGAGTFLLSGNLTSFRLQADSSIYGSSYENIFGLAGDFTNVKFLTAAVAPGYARNFVWKSWFVGAAAAVGPGVNWIYYQTGTDAERSSVQLNTYFDVRLAFGYNSERLFTGITYSRLVRNITYESNRFTSSNEVFKFAIGYRFKQVGILKKNIMDLIRPKTSG